MKSLSKSWELKKLRNFLKARGGFAFKSKEFVNDGIPIIRISNFDNSDIDLSDCVFYPKEKVNQFKDYLVGEGDILIAMSGATTGKIGRILGIKNQLLLNQRVGKFDIFDIQLDKNFLYFFIKTPYFQKQVWKFASGCAQPNVSSKQLESIEIPFLSLQVQKKIVSILEKAEKLRERRQKASEETNKIIQSIFYKMFGDPQRNPREWKVCSMLYISVEKPQYGSGAKAIPYDGKTRYIRITDVDEDGSLREDLVSPSWIDKKYLLEKGDLLFARSGATVGKTYLHKENVTNSIYAGYMIRFRFKKEMCNPDFVFALTKTNYYKKWILTTQTQVAQPNINAQQYGTLGIILPPIELQNKFASMVRRMGKIQQHQQKSEQEINNLFDVLMQKAFKGELTNGNE